MKLIAKDTSYRYREGGAPVLNKICFEAESGSFWCVAGPNGSGKSTLLKLASGLLPMVHFEGELSWDTRPVIEMKRLELARSIAFVAGGLRTHFPVTVGELVLHGRYPRSQTLWSQPTAADRDAADSCIDRVGINALAEKTVLEISSGELQLALIARALAQEPKALVLDEATANLDLRYQLRIFELLGELNAKGMTILLVSHDLNLAAEFCPNALWLNDGAVYKAGTMKETLQDSLMADIYGVENRAAVGESPFTKRPKIFWK